MLFVIVITFLISLLCLFFGLLLGVKMADLFGVPALAAVGPLAALAIGIGFGLQRIPFEAGITAGIIGALGSAVALLKGRP